MSVVYCDVCERQVDTDYDAEHLEEHLEEHESQEMRYSYFETVSEAIRFIGEMGLSNPHVMRKINRIIPHKPWVVYWYE